MNDRPPTAGRWLQSMLAGALAGAAAAGFNFLSGEAAPAPTRGIDGEAARYDWRLGGIHYEVGGPEEGAPMLLLHGIHAAASNYEFRKQFDYFAARGFRVYAPDLLGFGLSDHPALDYDDEIYIALVADFTRDVVTRAGGAAPVVIASTLTCSYVIAAAVRYPDRFGPLVLVEPVGLQQLTGKTPILGDLTHLLFKSPVVGELLFNLLTSPPSLRYYLRQQGYLDPAAVTDEMIDYHAGIANQRNARHAPAAFISGRLGRNIREEWARLEQPVLLAWGYQATTVPVTSGTEFLRLNPRAVVNGYDARLLPHDEQGDRFNHDTLAWLEGRRKD